MMGKAPEGFQIQVRWGGGKEGRESHPPTHAAPLALPSQNNLNPRTEAIIFIPATPNGELCKLLQNVDDAFSKLNDIPRIRYIEQGGTKLENILGRKNPWAGVKCQREDCLPCQNDDEKTWGQCQEENVVYNIKCEGCAKNGKVSDYTG